MFKRLGCLKAVLLLTVLILASESVLFAKTPVTLSLSYEDLTLSGKWDYYRMELLQPFDFYPENKAKSGAKVTLPHRFEVDSQYATFHYRQEHLVPNKHYATTLHGTIISCFRLWCNGKLVATAGFLSKDKNDAKPGDCLEIIDLRADSNGVIDLLLHVANYEDLEGGIIKPISITGKQRATKLNYLYYFFNAFLAIFICCHILYNGILAFLTSRRNNHITIFFLCIFFIASILLTGFSVTQKVMPYIPFQLYRKLPMLLFCIESSFLVLYEATLFKTHYKTVALFNLLPLAEALAIILIPLRAFEDFKVLFSGLAIICSIMSIAIPTKLIPKSKIEERNQLGKTVFLHNIRNLLSLTIIILCILDFVVIPQKQSAIHSYLFFKIAILIFGVVQCGIYAFNRDWTLSRVNRYSAILSQENDRLSKFVSDQVLKLMGATDITRIIPGECRIIDALILCVRIKHYSQLAETIDRKELFSIAQEFYKSFSPIILDSGGFVAKYTNGGFVAFFQQKNNDAITCAARIQNKLREFRRVLRKTSRTDVNVGVSIHSGKAAIGTMGTNYRLDTAALSSDVDLAYAVAKQTSKTNSQILITEDAMPYCRGFIDYMYEGHFFILNGKQYLVYSATPITQAEDTYEETLEVIEDEDEI